MYVVVMPVMQPSPTSSLAENLPLPLNTAALRWYLFSIDNLEAVHPPGHIDLLATGVMEQEKAADDTTTYEWSVLY